MMTTGSRIRVLIVDDHTVVRVGLKHILEQSGEFEVVGLASDGAEAVSMAAELSPEVVVMDLIMPKKNGMEACREIMQSVPETRVVMLTVSTGESAVVEAVAAGATGFVHKETGRERLLSAVRDVALGELRVPADIVRQTFAAAQGGVGPEDSASAAGLTPREREILVAFASGMSYARIAEARGIKPVTVRNAIYRVQDKLGASTMQELVLWSVRHGLVSADAAGR